MQNGSDYFTPRVDARTSLARVLSERGPDFLRAHRLTAEDLEAIITHGEAARVADRQQQEQLAEVAVARAGRKVSAVQLAHREDELAALLPAVIDDLVATNAEEAGFLAKLSFARYRTRVHSVRPQPMSDEDVATIETIQRVERSDIPTRAKGLSALCTTLRGRAPIVHALAARGLDAAQLEALAGDAEQVASHGRNQLRPVEATEREAAAVAAQRAKWSAIKKLVRRACASDRDLAALFADC